MIELFVKFGKLVRSVHFMNCSLNVCQDNEQTVVIIYYDFELTSQFFVNTFVTKTILIIIHESFFLKMKAVQVGKRRINTNRYMEEYIL